MALSKLKIVGDCKLPYPDGGAYFPFDIADHREVSFIGRPFPLTDTGEHFFRLAR